MKMRQAAGVLALIGLLLSGVLLGLQTAMADVNAGLIAHYPFNGNANDETGNGYDGTVDGATLSDDGFGNPSSAFSFDGSNDKILIGQAPENFPSLNAYAVSVWFLNNGGGNQGQGYGQKILSKGDFFTDFHLSVGPDGGPDGYLSWWSDQGGFESVTDTSQDYRDNLWHHVVLNKKTASEGDLWVDGVLRASSNTLKAVMNSVDLVIGYTAHTDVFQQKYWSGKIDDIRIYNRVLSESEILELFVGVVNNLVTFEPKPSTFSFTPVAAGCPTGFAGIFSFNAQLTNIADRTLAHLQVAIATLTDENVLLTDEGLLGRGEIPACHEGMTSRMKD